MDFSKILSCSINDMSGSVHEADVGSFDRHPVLFIKSRSSEHWSYIFQTKLRISPETRGFASRTSNSGESLLSKAVATTLTDRGADVEVVVVVEDTGVLKADDKRVLTYE